MILTGENVVLKMFHFGAYSLKTMSFQKDYVIPANAGIYPNINTVFWVKKMFDKQYCVYILASQKYGTL